MKVLMIGGTGNISTPISQALAARGEDVILYNRGNHPVAGTRQVQGDRNQTEIFEQQLRDLAAREGRFDVVIDMICYHPEHGRSLVRGLDGKVDQLIFCSTVDVYTKTKSGYPINEHFEREPQPAFTYAYHKAIIEKELEAAAQRGAFGLTIFRPAATYNDHSLPIALLGPGEALLNRIRAGKPVIVLGDGNGIWASAHRDDVAPAFVAAVGNPHALGKAYNVCGEEWMTWKTYFSTAAKVMGAPEIDFVCIPAELLARISAGEANWSAWNFQYNNIFDNTSARNDLNFRCRVTWEEGLTRMVACQDTKGSIANAPPYPLYDRVIAVWQKHVRDMEISDS
jgi:nucleoside-diphosphate-sugar epimerase